MNLREALMVSSIRVVSKLFIIVVDTPMSTFDQSQRSEQSLVRKIRLAAGD